MSNRRAILRSFFWWIHPKRFLWALGVFFNDWWWSRPWKRLLYCSPILGVLGMTFMIAVLYLITPTPRIAYRYANAANQAIAEKQFETAELYTRKLIALAPENLEYRFIRAQLADEAGESERAWAYMKELAPDDDMGHPKAHRWIAAKMLSRQSERTPEQLALARRHMEQAVLGAPEDVAARQLLVQLYLVDQQYEMAAKHLAVVTQEIPQTGLGLARLYAFIGEPDLAKEAAARVGVHFQNLLRQDRDDLEARLRLAETHAFLKEYQPAERILVEGLKRRPGESNLRQLLSQVYVVWSDQLPPSRIDQRLTLIQQAMELNPAEFEVLKRMAQFAVKDSPHAEETRAQLYDVLASGQAQATVHMILGTIFLQDGDFEKALFHLTQANAQEPRIPAVVNNLAYLLARVDPPQLDRALELAEAAVELVPDSAEIRETRGDIHFKMMNWEKAISDMEFALGEFPDRVTLHEKLAVAYEAVGQTELAERHRRSVQEDDEPPEEAN